MLMKIKEFDDALYYRVGCDCGVREHDLEIWAEVDKEGYFPTINFSANCHTRYWNNRFSHPLLKWLNDPLNRISIALTVLFTGHVETNFEYCLGKENVSALRTALDEIERKLT